MLPDRQIKYIYEELGSRIRSERLKQGYKQTTFAGLLRISRASLVNIEQGRQHPPLHNLYEIARILKIPLGDLLPELVEEVIKDVDAKLYKQIELKSDGNPELQKKLLEFVKTQNSIKTK